MMRLARSLYPLRRTAWFGLSLGLLLLYIIRGRDDLFTRTSKPHSVLASIEKLNCEIGDPVRRIAVIGAGAAGATVAYTISQARNHCPLQIDVFERNAYIGGRSTTVDVYDDPRLPVELGASIFVKANHNLVAAVKKFGLSTESKTESGVRPISDKIGVYDGHEFVLQLEPDSHGKWWTLAKILWKYGMSPIRTRKLTQSTVAKFLRLYESPMFPFSDLTRAVQNIGLADVANTGGLEYLRQNVVSDAFARDVIQASTRVNYAQNLETIHAVETMVCMATDGAMAVSGGNWQIFANMLDHANVHVHLNNSVSKITQLQNGTFLLKTHDAEISTLDREPGRAGHYGHYDSIVLAAPFQYSNIDFEPPLQPESMPIPADFVSLHVTLFSFPHLPDPAKFHLPHEAKMPTTILTTTPKDINESGAQALPYLSISVLGTAVNPRSGNEEYIFKIFSLAPISPAWLMHAIFADSACQNQELCPVAYHAANRMEKTSSHTWQDLGFDWHFVKVWDSYPVEKPRREFDRLKLDFSFRDRAADNVYPLSQSRRKRSNPSMSESEPASALNEMSGNDQHITDALGIWYTGGMEPFISTMETSSLMGRNIAALMVKDFNDRYSRRRSLLGTASKDLDLREMLLSLEEPMTDA